MKFLILFTAIVLAAIAAYFSVYGLHKLFIGAGTSIIILGSILEASKLVTVAFLHQKWKEIGGILKTYLVFAVIVLMLITSLGIYGYLANGYNATAIKIEKYEQQIAENTDIIDSLSDNLSLIHI